MTQYIKLQKVTVDTGGNCMIDLYKVPAGSDIKWIGITDDCIVGYTIDDPLQSQGPSDEPWYIDISDGKQPNIPHGQIYDDYLDNPNIDDDGNVIDEKL